MDDSFLKMAREVKPNTSIMADCCVCKGGFLDDKLWIDTEREKYICVGCKKLYMTRLSRNIGGVEDGTNHYIWTGKNQIILD